MVSSLVDFNKEGAFVIEKATSMKPEFNKTTLQRLALPILGTLLILLSACGSATSTPGNASDPTAHAGERTPDVTGETEPSANAPTEQSFAGETAAPEFPPNLDWLNTERPLSLDQLKGKLVLLDFWTYGCINCMHIIPELSRLENEYPNELVVIGVHSAKFENEGDTDNIRQVILRYGLEHPVVNDSEFIVWRTWGARAWPTLVLIDPAGNVVGGHSGENIYPIFKPVIESLVQEFDAKGILDRTPLDLKLEKQGLPATVLSFPGKVLADEAQGRLFIADTNHNRVVIVDIENGEVLDVIGSGEADFKDGNFSQAAFFHPQGLALDSQNDFLYVADTDNHSIRKVDLGNAQVSTVAGYGQQGQIYPPVGGNALEVALRSPWDVEFDQDRLFIAMAGTHQIWTLDLEAGIVQPFVGNAREGTADGPLDSAELAQPSGLALDDQGRLYFADSEASSIRWADTDPPGNVETIVGSGESLFEFGDIDGVGNQARLQHPLGVTIVDDLLYIADTYNHKIKLIDPSSSEITTFLGDTPGWRDGSEPLFYEPGGLDFAGGKLYVADTNNHAIRIIDIETMQVSTLVLKGIERFSPAAGDENFAGTVVESDPVEIQAGAGSIVLNIQLPDGYKVNEDAPSSFFWQEEGGVVEFPEDANISIAGAELPYRIEVDFRAGSGTLISDVNLIYCEAEKESLCLIEQLRFEVPITVGDSGLDTLSLDYIIPIPDIVGS
jgi:DNA-binding beta-propeller fold protein YncE